MKQMACTNAETFGGDLIEDIPPKFLYKLQSGNATQCFDLRELGSWIESKVRDGIAPTNPQTRETFSRAQLDAIQDAIAESQKDTIKLNIDVYFGFLTEWLSASSLGGLLNQGTTIQIDQDKTRIVQWIRETLTREERSLQSFGNFKEFLQVLSSGLSVDYELVEIEVPNTNYIDERFVKQSRTQRCSYNVGNITENLYGFLFRLNLRFTVKGYPNQIANFNAQNLIQSLETFFKVRFFSGPLRSELKRLDLANVRSRSVLAVPVGLEPMA